MLGRASGGLAAAAALLASTVHSSLAGPNAGGTLILHANTNLTYSAETSSYCAQGGLASCSQANVSVAADPEVTTVFFVYAAFPGTASPRLLAVTFGIDYDDEDFALVSEGHCADFALPDDDWPDPTSGTALTWESAETGTLVELAWFAGYAAAEEVPTSFELTEHPTQGADFADDSVPAVLDAVVAFGRLGFGETGYRPCPGFGQGGGFPDGPEGGEGPVGAGTSGVIKAVTR
jgi:hypothetical protein